MSETPSAPTIGDEALLVAARGAPDTVAILWQGKVLGTWTNDRPGLRKILASGRTVVVTITMAEPQDDGTVLLSFDAPELAEGEQGWVARLDAAKDLMGDRLHVFGQAAARTALATRDRLGSAAGTLRDRTKVAVGAVRGGVSSMAIGARTAVASTADHVVAAPARAAAEAVMAPVRATAETAGNLMRLAKRFMIVSLVVGVLGLLASMLNSVATIFVATRPAPGPAATPVTVTVSTPPQEPARIGDVLPAFAAPVPQPRPAGLP